MNDGIIRCAWPGEDPLYVAYHDKEWGVPEYDSRALYEKLVLDGFQAGLSWITILRKRENFRKAFHGFDPEKIARYGKRDFARLMKNEGIIRSNAKIKAAIKGAQLWLDIKEKEPGGFRELIWKHVDGKPKHQQLQTMQAGARENEDERRAGEGTETARLQFLRAGDRLCLRAGHRHGQRSCRDCHRHAECAKLAAQPRPR